MTNNPLFSVSPSMQNWSLEPSGNAVEKNLALIGRSERWTIIDARKEVIPSEGIIIQGNELVEFMKAAANGMQQLPASFQNKEFKDLTRNSEFRGFCRRIPGIEDAEHIRTRNRQSEALQQAFESTKIIGKGLMKIESKQQQGHFIGNDGRFVGQDQKEHSYWIREVVFRDPPRIAGEIDLLRYGWQQDKGTHLSLKEWEAAKKEEWQKANSGKDFLPWVAANAWEAEQKEEWQKDNPGKTFDVQNFADWQKAQNDPVLGFPTWLLKLNSGKTNDTDFQIWRTKYIQQREKEWKNFKEETGASSVSFADFDKDLFISGSIEHPQRGILRNLWNETISLGKTQDDFPTFMKRLKWEHETQLGQTNEPFDRWQEQQEQAIRDRHIGTHTPLSFEAWQAQQDDSLFTEPAPFILLGKEERKIYATTFENGILIRNAHPFNTEFEKTRHSGMGFAIFVIGPDEDLYCGSHIGNVFHHSSFLGEGAIVTAGEIKTNPDGSIAELSSKSGHYTPKDSQNLYMLNYFKNKGLDLQNIKFTFYDTDGETGERNALQYLEELEHIAALGNVDPELFS